MVEEFIQIGVTSVVAICGFFAVRWINAFDDKVKGITEDLESIKERLRTLDEIADKMSHHAVMEDTCAANHNEMLKCINRERYRINNLEDRLNSGEFKLRAPKKSFSDLGREAEQERLAKLLKGGGI